MFIVTVEGTCAVCCISCLVNKHIYALCQGDFSDTCRYVIIDSGLHNFTLPVTFLIQVSAWFWGIVPGGWEVARGQTGFCNATSNSNQN